MEAFMFTPDQAKGLSMVFMQSLGQEVPTTRRVLAAVPEAQLDFKLGDKGRTTRQLMWHIVQSEKWFGSSIIAGNFPHGRDRPTGARHRRGNPGLLRSNTCPRSSGKDRRTFRRAPGRASQFLQRVQLPAWCCTWISGSNTPCIIAASSACICGP
jgi:hypothetical protein